ncbi:MAG TPA: hypothetical protein VK970_15435 [Candidatus Methylacidiphilales bacterium]|nr:hypothetical protein [Candidatus Methylacidiphilales bacterium]
MTRDTQRKILFLAGALLLALVGCVGVVIHYIQQPGGIPGLSWIWSPTPVKSAATPKPQPYSDLQKDGVTLPLQQGGRESTAAAEPEQKPASAPKAPPLISPYETPNPWNVLEKFQGTMTRAEFDQRVKELFDPFGGLPAYIDINDERLQIFASASPQHRELPQYTLRFAPKPEARATWMRPFRSPAEFRALPKPPDKPLQGLRIAIDPGHIGGDWAKIEERCTRYKGSDYVKEGDLNLITAFLLRKQLEDLGAIVYLVREANEPVTPYRPIDFVDDARRRLVEESKGKSLAKLIKLTPEQQTKTLGTKVPKLAEFLFYRSSEIIERGSRIRNKFKADITITLYINATPSSGRGGLTSTNRNIFFVHGAYMKKEVDDAKQRLRMIHKIMEGGTDIEVEVAGNIANVFKRVTGFAPVLYGDSATTRKVSDNPYVVARNLAANREYDGPVVCTEPYFMNEVNTYPRLLAGDFEGERKFNGKMFKSIFREYADCVVNGLLSAYSSPSTELKVAKKPGSEATAGN